MKSIKSILNYKWHIILFCILISVFILYSIIIARSATLTDDGGITFRYIERLSQGKGFSYNDGEYVNGASNPLYVVIVSVFNVFIKNIQLSSQIVGVISLIATIIGALILFLKYKNPIGLIIYSLLLIPNHFILVQYFDGLEPGFTCMLITFFCLSLYSENFKLTGIFLGLLVANKLDAGLGAIAFTIVYVLSKKSFPFKSTIWAIIAALPVALILLYSFGSVLPQSMLSKLGGPANDISKTFDHLWMIKLVYHVAFYIALTFIISLPGILIKKRFADFVLLIYFALYLAVYSTVNLGDKYPWYSVGLIYIMILLASINFANILSALLNYCGDFLLKEKIYIAIKRFNLRYFTIISLACCIIITVWNIQKNNWNGELAPYEKGNLSRQAAGAWLKKVTNADEVLFTGWGLPAFEYRGPTFDPVKLTSPFDKSNNAVYAIWEFPQGSDPYSNINFAQAYPGSEDENLNLVATFKIPDAPQFYSIYASDKSSLSKKLKNSQFSKSLTLSDLNLIKNDETLYGNQVMQINGNDLFAHAPSDFITTVDFAENYILSFRPELQKDANGSDGVTFVVEMNDKNVYMKNLKLGEETETVQIILENNANNKTKIRFKTLPGENYTSDWAWYRNITIQNSKLDFLNPSDFTFINERQINELNKTPFPQY